jgi:hypothetical protein
LKDGKNVFELLETLALLLVLVFVAKKEQTVLLFDSELLVSLFLSSEEVF